MCWKILQLVDWFLQVALVVCSRGGRWGDDGAEGRNHHLCGLLLFIFLNLLIYLSLVALGLRCCVWAFSSCGERGLLFVAVRGLLTVVASPVAEHGLYVLGLQ